MTTAVATRQNGLAPARDEKAIAYKPLGSNMQIELTIDTVRKFVCTPTKKGKLPTDSDIVKFMMLCRARELDPWVGDAFLTGYDTQDGPSFSLITSVQALLKRAELSPNYDGMEYGIVVKNKAGELSERQGKLVLEGEKLVGGWARCYRKDRKMPAYDAVNFATFNTGYSRWAKDPAGMIAKCAMASVLREAFPTQLGGLYTGEELDHMSQSRIANRGDQAPAAKELTGRIMADQPEQPKLTEAPEPSKTESTAEEQQTEPSGLDDSAWADIQAGFESQESEFAVDAEFERVKPFCKTDADRKRLKSMADASKQQFAPPKTKGKQKTAFDTSPSGTEV